MAKSTLRERQCAVCGRAFMSAAPFMKRVMCSEACKRESKRQSWRRSDERQRALLKRLAELEEAVERSCSTCHFWREFWTGAMACVKGRQTDGRACDDWRLFGRPNREVQDDS